MTAFWDEHEELRTGPEARGPQLFVVDESPEGLLGRAWRVRQVLDDSEGDHDWSIVAEVDLDASDAAGIAVVRTREVGAFAW